MRGYVHGTLYSIFTRPSIRKVSILWYTRLTLTEVAFSLGLNEQLDAQKLVSDARMQQQISFIIDQLRSESPGFQEYVVLLGSCKRIDPTEEDGYESSDAVGDEDDGPDYGSTGAEQDPLTADLEDVVWCFA